MIRRLRLISGCTLFIYVCTHLIPLILGNHSLYLTEMARPWVQDIWQSWVGITVLYSAMLVHAGLGFWALYLRRTWRGIRVTEALQIITGVSIPMLLALHWVSTRLAATLYEIDPTYPWILAIYFQYDMAAGWRQGATLLVAWFHGCLGLYLWLRLKPFWQRYRFLLFGGSLVMPTMALTGYYNAGTDAKAMTADQEWVRSVISEVGFISQDGQAFLYGIEATIIFGVVALIVFSLASRVVVTWIESRRAAVMLKYDDGTTYRFHQGLSLLEASNACQYPHASVCGGKGRCSTCRVRIRRGAELLPPPTAAEQKVLSRVKAGKDVRLACQTIPEPGEIEISTLLPPNATPRNGHTPSDVADGKEMEIAVMFCDLRGFTKVSEERLPYDTVFLLNRYFDAMGKAITESDGHLDKFIGDGVMALFGVDGDVKKGCKDALIAARRMGERLKALNDALEADLEAPLRIGIGIHVGSVIVGEMGFGTATQLTAIGDAVNTASRLEAATKDFGAQLVGSRAVFRLADVNYRDNSFEAKMIEIRGRAKPITVIAVKDTAELPS